MWNLISLFHLSRQFFFSLHPNTIFSLKTSYPHDFRPNLVSNHLVWSLYPSFFMNFTHLDLGFGFHWNFWGFWKLMSILWNCWVGCCVFYAIWSCIAFHLHFTMFHAFRCVSICWKLCVVRFGLGWTHDALIFARHMLMHIPCIRILY